MPSLPTNNTHCGCPSDSYRRYLPSGYQSSFELYEKNRIKILCSFFQWLIFCTLMTVLLLSGNYFFQYLHWQLLTTDIYYKNKIDYLATFTWFFLLCLYCCIIIYICFRQIHQHDIRYCLCLFSTKKWKSSIFLISFIICILIMYSIEFILLSLYYYNANHSHFNILCNIFTCRHFRYDTIFNYVIAPPLSLCIMCTIIHVLFFGFSTLPCSHKKCCCYDCNKPTTKNNVSLLLLHNEEDEEDEYNEQDDDEEDINSVDMSELTYIRYMDDDSSMTSNIDHIQRQKNKILYYKYPEIVIVKYFYFYCIGLFLVYFVFFIASNLENRFYDNTFTVIYILMLCFTEITKWCLKRIARIIDMSRSHEILIKPQRKRNTRIRSSYSKKEIRSVSYLSFELLTELFMSSVYWLSYRELVMYDIPTWNQFWRVKIAHIAIECFYFSIRPSNYYWNITKYLQNNCCLCRLYNDDNKTFFKLLLNWKDDSSQLQWKIRCSLDIVVKFTASVISSIVIAIEVIILGYSTFDESKQLYDRGIIYNLISTAIEVIYFVLIYLYYLRIHQFSMVEPFWSIYTENKKLIICTTAIFVCQAFWFPDLGA